MFFFEVNKGKAVYLTLIKCLYKLSNLIYSGVAPSKQYGVVVVFESLVCIKDKFNLQTNQFLTCNLYKGAIRFTVTEHLIAE